MQATIYSTPKCVFCTKAYNLLKTYNVEVEKVMIEADTSNFPTQTQYNTHMYESVQKKAKDNFDDIKKICQESGQQMRSVPQVLIDGKLIGGFEEIEEWCKITFEG